MSEERLIKFSSVEFWRENKGRGGGYAALTALSLIFFCHLFKLLYVYLSGFLLKTKRSNLSRVSPPNSLPSPGISNFVSDDDLKSLIENLDEKSCDTEKWENVIEKSRSRLYYKAKCCKPEDGPLKYVSVTVFEDCSPETLRDFYLDCEYRKEWDKTVVDHVQLQIDEKSGVEIGRTIKKFPLLTRREYVSAWKVWEGSNKTYYCYSKVNETICVMITKDN